MQEALESNKRYYRGNEKELWLYRPAIPNRKVPTSTAMSVNKHEFKVQITKFIDKKKKLKHGNIQQRMENGHRLNISKHQN